MSVSFGYIASLLAGLGGLAIGIACTLREQRRSRLYRRKDEALATREALVQEALQASNDGYWQWNTDTRDLQLSARVYELLGYVPIEQPLASTFMRSIVHEDDLRANRRLYVRHLRERGQFRAQYRLRVKSGDYQWFGVRGQTLLDKHGTLRSSGSFFDITEHKRSQEQQKRLETELAQSQKLESIGQLAAGIAHEINTPTQFIGNNVGFVSDSVGEILGVVEKIRDAAATSRGELSAQEVLATLESIDLRYLVEEVPLAIKQSQEGIDRIQRIVGAMKEFSHPAVEKTPLDVNRAINSTIIVASNEWKYVAEMVTHLDPDLPSVSLMPGSFNQVILNLIVNAAHAISEVADRGRGTITVSTRRVDACVEVTIRDTGSGIPEDIRDRIFDPFFTTKPAGKGTGQGLAIAHDVVVNKHGGTIAVQSSVGGGTAFILRLPLGPQLAGSNAAA